MSKEHNFTHVKTTQQFYKFAEVDEDGVVLKKGDAAANFNFGCIYLKKEHFQIEPNHLTITVQAHYEKD